MGDRARSDARGGTGADHRAKLGGLLLLAAAIAAGLVLGGASVVGTTGPAEETGDDANAVAIAGECVAGDGVLTIENPTEAAATVAMNWSVEQSAIEVRLESENATQTIRVGGATAEQSVSIGSDDRTVAVEFEPGLLNVTIPAEEELTIRGLADGTYEVSSADEGSAPVEPDTVTVDCESSGTVNTTGTEESSAE
ncbi:hypothetical protein [Halosolutus gelatinilyticus]|uniref:hypothetical protein n=1 Tax=Halosolutus gelatinilyticus TaxID=2931975 RepID=UPI001FF0E20D|nr:hypothetical protein [Halosolutus gelatinilyticus]